MKRLFFIISLLLCLPLAAQQTYRARVVDAETGEALPHAIVHLPGGNNMMTDASGVLCVKAKEGKEICVKSIGYNQVKVKVNQMGTSILLSPYVDIMEELQPAQALDIMAKVLEKLKRELPRHHNSTSHYFSRLSVNCEEKHEMAEIFHTSRSMLNLHGSVYHIGRRFTWPKNVEQDSSFFNSNLQQLLECGPASILYSEHKDDGRPIHLHVSGLNSRSSLFYSSLLQTPDYMCYGISLADVNGRKIYRIKLARVQKRGVPYIEGIVNVDAQSSHILSFEGVMCNYVIDLQSDQGVRSLPATISTRITYTHSRGFAEVESVVCEAEAENLQCSVATLNLHNTKLPFEAKNSAYDHMLESLNEVGYDTALWEKSIIIQRSTGEDIIAGNGKTEVKNSHMRLPSR